MEQTKPWDQWMRRTFLVIRNNPILFRFTLGLRILLAIAFIPTGAIKLLGMRFTEQFHGHLRNPAPFFEALYHTGTYWKFLGATQVMAGLLILWHRTSLLGTVMFLAITSNILFIVLSYDFGLTVYVVCGMILSCLWLILWHWDRARSLFGAAPVRGLCAPSPKLSGNVEKGFYGMSLLSGLTFFSVLRGLESSIELVIASVILGSLGFLGSVVLALRNK